MNNLLKVAIGLCLLFSAIRLGEFVYMHIPPFSEGECREVAAMPLIIVKIDVNHIVEGYSDVEVQFAGLSSKTTGRFSELREALGKKAECQ